MIRGVVNIVALVVAVAAGFVLARCTDEPNVLVRVPETAQDGVGPRELLDPERPVSGLLGKLKTREVSPAAVYVTTSAKQEEQGREAGKEPRPDSTAAAVRQVTYREGVLSIFVGDSTAVREYQFRTRPAFDAVMPHVGPPRVFEDRCWVCDPQLFIDAGAATALGAGVPEVRPYAAADLSVAVLSPRLRVFLRPEVWLGRQGRLLAGGRLVVF